MAAPITTVTHSRPMVLTTSRLAPDLLPTTSSHQLVWLNPSNATPPKSTATSAVVPGTAPRRGRARQGTSEKRASNPSPRRSHPRPHIAMPAVTATAYTPRNTAISRSFGARSPYTSQSQRNAKRHAAAVHDGAVARSRSLPSLASLRSLPVRSTSQPIASNGENDASHPPVTVATTMPQRNTTTTTVTVTNPTSPDSDADASTTSSTYTPRPMKGGTSLRPSGGAGSGAGVFHQARGELTRRASPIRRTANARRYASSQRGSGRLLPAPNPWARIAVRVLGLPR